MITKKTVLVIGAGSSKDFGVDLGSELIKSVSNFSKSPNNYIKKYEEFKEIAPLLTKRLNGPGITSIDEFLTENPEFLELGKLAIWNRIHICEIEASKGSLLRDNLGWIEELFSNMKSGTSASEFGKNNLKIVSFNYDRILPQALLIAASNFYNKKYQDTIAEQINKIETVNVHGCLGPLEWQLHDKTSLAWGRGIDRDDSYNYTQNIKILSEVDKESFEFQKARDFLKWADRIVILGFGFNSDNMVKLFFKNESDRIKYLKGKQIFSMGYGLSLKDKFKIASFFNRTPASTNSYYSDLNFRINSSNYTFFSEETINCSEYLKKDIALDEES